MRVALDATYSVDANPSGIAIYSRELVHGLTSEHPDDEFLLCYRPKQFRLAPHPNGGNTRRTLLLPPLPTFRADIFHSLNQRVDKRPARRVVSTFHDLFVMTGEYSSPAFRTRFTRHAQAAAANSDFILADSEFTAAQVRWLLNFDEKRIRVVPLGVHFQEAGVPGVFEREKIILFVGTLQLRKNISRLVRAFKAVPDSWRLLLVGSPTGYQADSILEQIENSPARGRIEVCRYLPEAQLEDLYRRASIFAFPSLDEGFGLPILEAMAQGIPVLTSNRSAMAEIGAGAALLVDPSNEDEIASGLLRLAMDEELRCRLAEQGRLKAQQYPWSKTCAATYEIYSQLR